jgi:hypothetical protein
VGVCVCAGVYVLARCVYRCRCQGLCVCVRVLCMRGCV